jgi:hypothetical protein
MGRRREEEAASEVFARKKERGSEGGEGEGEECGVVGVVWGSRRVCGLKPHSMPVLLLVFL